MGEISLSDRYRRQMIARDLSDSHEGEKCDCREIVNTIMKDGSAENTAQTSLSVHFTGVQKKSLWGRNQAISTYTI